MEPGPIQQNIIGLTGMYCAGKNYVARLLEARGLPVLDVDILGHQAIAMEKAAILEQFGDAILGKDGAIDRRLLGAKVFGNSGALAMLEGIVHPRANALTNAWIDTQGTRPCVINAALLHKSSAFDRLSFIMLVKAPTFIRLVRARKRDMLSWNQLMKRFQSQKQFIAQYLQKNTDIYTIHNRGYSVFGSHFCRQQVERQLDKILALKGIVKDTSSK